MMAFVVLNCSRPASRKLSCICHKSDFPSRVHSFLTYRCQSSVTRNVPFKSNVCLSLKPDAERKTVKVLFLPDNIEVTAYPGESISQVAERANVEIVQSCSVGECGVCDVQLVDQQSGTVMYLRSCITKVPAHKEKLVLDTIGDSIPPW